MNFCFRDKANKYSALSGDQIRLQIGQLNAKKAMLEALKSAPMTPQAIKAIVDAQNLQLKASKELNDSTQDAEINRQSCASKRGCEMSLAAVPCDDFSKSSDAASNSITRNSQIFACAASVSLQLNTTLQLAYYDQVIKDIDTSIKEYQKALYSSQVPLSQLARHAADSKEQLDSGWMQFAFDSSKSSEQTDTSYSYSSYSASARVGVGWFSGSASYSASKAEQDYSKQMNRAKVAVKGELFRVTIQRPWFRPSIFRSAQFQMVSNLLYNSYINFRFMHVDAYIHTGRQHPHISWRGLTRKGFC